MKMPRSFLKNNAFLLIACYPLLLILCVTVALSSALTYMGQNKIALHYRLQICSMRILHLHHSILGKIVQLNKTMLPLQQIIYLARGIKLIPLANLPANITEKSALFSLRLIQRAQEALFYHPSPLLLKFCKKSPYSKEQALCFGSRLSRKYFHRQKTLFADVPGTLFIEKSTNTITCRALNAQRSLVYTIDPALMSKKLRYEYQ